MQTDLETLSSERAEPFRSQVCIVGGGIAGLVLATTLANAGRDVHLLEAGGLTPEERSQSLYAAAMAGTPHSGTTEGRFRIFGGSSTQWGGQLLPYRMTCSARLPVSRPAAGRCGAATLAPSTRRWKTCWARATTRTRLSCTASSTASFRGHPPRSGPYFACLEVGSLRAPQPGADTRQAGPRVGQGDGLLPTPTPRNCCLLRMGRASLPFSPATIKAAASGSRPRSTSSPQARSRPRGFCWPRAASPRQAWATTTTRWAGASTTT